MDAILRSCNITLSQKQLDQLWAYHGLLRRSNQALNLTRIHNFDNMVIKLYADSMLPATLMALPSPLMDLGSGPGMPGILLKIFRPELKIILAESRSRRCDFLREVIETLRLTDVTVLAQKIHPGIETPVAGIITRAVEKVEDTLERVAGCLSPNGLVIFMKGPECAQEIETAARRFQGQFEMTGDQAYYLGATQHRRRLLVYRRLDEPVRILREDARKRYATQIIASEQNRRFKGLKKVLSSRGIKKSGQALVAGSRQVVEILAKSPQQCRAWVSCAENQPPPKNGPATMEWLQLNEKLFRQLDVFGTGAPLLLIDVPVIEPWRPADGFGPGCSLLVPFQDPENIGAVIRSAVAFGVHQVILLSESAHPFHPKALRASGGAVLNIPIRSGPALNRLPKQLPVLALSPDGRDLDEVFFPDSFGLLAGMEGPGLPDAWRSTALRIPIGPDVESLNAATATAIALYAWRFQIRNQGA